MTQRLFLALALLALWGCAHQAPIPTPANLAAHQQTLNTLQHWQVTGKLGIRTDQDSGSASLKWLQTTGDYRINLSGPLGQKSIIITGSPGKVVLEAAGQPPLSATSPEALIKQSAGWTLPVTQLAYWIRGIPAPQGKITHLATNEFGLVAELQQGGWTIHYDQYRPWSTATTTLPMPQKITATYQDIRLVLAIRDWQLGTRQ